MEIKQIFPVCITQRRELISWLDACLEQARPFQFEPLQTFGAVAEANPSSGGDQTILFLDLSRSAPDKWEELLSASHASFASSPVVVLAADEESGLAALQQGADDYLLAGQSEGRVLSRVVRYVMALHNRRERRQVQREERFRTFLENSPDIIYIFDLAAESITYFNRQKLLGFTAEELRRPGALTRLIYPEDRRAVRQHWAQLAQASPGDIFTNEHRLRRRNGEWEWVQSRETILNVDADGTPTQILASLSIITHRKKREAAVRRYAERLQILHEIDQAIVSARSPQAIAQAALRRISRLIPSHRASVAVFNWEAESFNVVAELPEGATGSNDNAPLPLSWFWALEELQEGELYRADDLSTLNSTTRTPLTEWLENQGVRSLITLPLLAQRQLVGALSFAASHTGGFSAEDIVVMREVAHVLAIAMAQARLYEQAHYHARKLEQRARRLLLVNDISLAMNRPIELQAVLEEAARGLGAVIDVRQIDIALLNESRDAWTLMSTYLVRRGARVRQLTIPLDDYDALQQLWQGRSYLAVENGHENVDRAPLQAILQEQGVENAILVPLQVSAGVIGLICCDSGPGLRRFSREEIELIQTIANLLSVKLEQIRLLLAERQARAQAEAHATNLRLRERHLTLLNAITRATTGLEPQEMLQAVVNRVGELSGADGCYVAVWDREQQTPVPTAVYGAAAEAYLAHRVPDGETTLTEKALRAGHPVIMEAPRTRALPLVRDIPNFPSQALLAVPLITGKEKLGALLLAFAGAYDFTEAEVSLYEQAAGQIAVALSAARLFGETRRQLEELRVLHALATAGAEASSEDELLERATELMGQTFFSDNFGVLLYDESRQVLYAHHSYRSGRHEKRAINVPLGEGICGHVARTGRPLRVPDVTEEARYVAADPETRSELCVPLRTGNRLLGVVNTESNQVNAYSAGHERLLLTFAHQLATAMEKLRLLQVERRRRREAETVSDVLHALNATPNVREAFAGVAASLRAITGCYRVSLALPNENRDSFSIFALDTAQRAGQDDRYPVHSTAAAEDVLSGEAHLTPDLSREREGQFEQMLYEAGQRSRMNLPLRVGDEVIGSLNLTWQEVQGYDEAQLPLLSQIASAVALAVERSRLFAETHRRAEELEVLTNLSAELRVADGAGDIVQILLASSTELFAADLAAIVMPDDDGRLRLAHQIGVPSALQKGEYRFEDSIFGHVLRSGKPYLTADVLNDPLAHEDARAAWTNAGLRPQAAIYAPLQAGEKMIGSVCLMVTSGRLFEEKDLRLLTAMAEIAGNALQRAGLMETLEQRVAERTRELAEANEQLQELDRLKSKFVSDISHELRTPITSVSLYLDLIERGNEEHSERYWSVLRKQTERLNHLIEDILSLSRLQMGKVELDPRPVDLNALVGELLPVHQNRFDQARLELQFTPAAGLPPVLGEPERLAQVITSLLENASNYTEEGSVRLHTLADEEAGMACLVVADSGVGMNEDDLSHIFERFYRGQYASQSNIPGTGLGLTIVEEIVNLHGGRIEVESEEGEGTTFRVWLPLAGDD
ncbi:MAG TPA: GAF domain-containing protein [Candidatus Sulfomarinibacteraceae bacterium]|nr:GAF domain-containing protein [Candidatus Sulfomarinibacteraceae bacterium]